jgi:isopenicillin N synthase-like dioxygenase
MVQTLTSIKRRLQAVILVLSGILFVTPTENVLPTIDISLCTQGNTVDSRIRCQSDIDAALRNYGTFIAIGHGIDPAFFEMGFENAKTLFSLDIEHKTNVSMSLFKDDFGRGYIPFGSEAGVSTYFEIKEGYSYGLPRKSSSEVFVKRNPMESLNVWPRRLAESVSNGLESVLLEKLRVTKIILTALIEAQDIHGTSNDFIRSLTTENNSDESKIHEKMISDNGDSISLMRLFHYFSSESGSNFESGDDSESKAAPNVNEVSDHTSIIQIVKKQNKVTIGSSPHTDWGLLTVIMQDEIGGLQFFHENQWKDVPRVPFSLVINGGDYLRIISKGRYHSPVHRVLCPPHGKERTSFVFFYYPGFNSTVTVQQGAGFARDEVVGDYNTFLEMQSDGTSSSLEGASSKTETFGDYILRKWQGVAVAVST